MIELKHASADEIAGTLTSFVNTDDGSKIQADAQANKLVLLLRKPLLESMVKLIRTLDVPHAKDELRVVKLKHLEAAVVAPVLEAFSIDEDGQGALGGVPAGAVWRVTGRKPAAAIEPSTPAGNDPQRPVVGQRWLVHFMIEPKLNVIVLRGLSSDVAATVELIEELDVEPDIAITSYQLKYTNAADVHDTLMRMVDEAPASRDGETVAAPRLRIAPSFANNRIIIEGSPRDQARVRRMIEAIDQPLPAGSGGVRVYRLENTTSAQVAAVLQDLVAGRQSDQYAQQLRADAAPSSRRRPYLEGDTPRLPLPPSAVAPSVGAGRAPAGGEAAPAAGAETGGEGQATGLTPGDVLPAQITDAPEINAVIIKASAVEHEEFAQIIKQLDTPRDQVVLEVTLVTVTASDDFRLGVELAGARLGDAATQSIGLTRFGIGAVDSATGDIRIGGTAPFGLNYALFNSNDFSLVINALQTVGDTRITSAPKILVQDNAQAQLSQVRQEPFEQSNQGETTTTTSFGGFVDAGTTLTVTPHISDDDWLQLQYAINLSSFTARVDPDLPPPRVQNTIQGIVRVPDNHMVALGGLLGTRRDEVIAQVPFLADIPGLGEFFKDRSIDESSDTLFVFIRPRVLRDPAFADLLYLSREDLEAAALSRQGDPRNPLKLMSLPSSIR